MRTIKLASVSVILALSGCASIVWDKPGATTQDFSKDSYECERDARMSGYFGSGVVGAINFEQFEERCMMARGWTKSAAASQNRGVSDQDLEEAKKRNSVIDR